MGRDVEGRGGWLVSGGRGSLKEARVGETRRMRPGCVAGCVPHLAYGTLGSRLGLVLMRVGRLGDGGDEEQERDGDSGECAHALPDSRWINAVNHP